MHISKFTVFAKKILIVSVFSLLSWKEAAAIGVGIVVNGPTGLSLKTNRRGTAYDGVIAVNKDSVLLQNQYIVQPFKVRALYLGIGVRVNLYLDEAEDESKEDDKKDKKVDFAARVPVGLSWSTGKLEFFGEVGLLLRFISSGLHSELAFGARYYL